jgi:hypothetical protein
MLADSMYYLVIIDESAKSTVYEGKGRWREVRKKLAPVRITS